MRWEDFVRLCPCFLLVLSGCGGGGGGGMATQPDPTQPAPTPSPTTCTQGIQTTEGCLSEEAYNGKVREIAARYQADPDFRNQRGLDAVNAGQAYGHLELAVGQEAPGTGVTVGVVDNGIKQTHPLFDQSKISETIFSTTPQPPREDHGTPVASVIVARPDSGVANGFHGVAWGATLKMVAVPLGDPPPPGTLYEPISLPTLKTLDPAEAALTQTVLNQGVDVVNLSFSLPGLIEYYSEAQLRENLGRTIAAMAQRGTADKTILVWAASNAHGSLCRPALARCVGSHLRDRSGNPAGLLNASSPSVLAGLPAKIPELRGHTIAVVAVDRNGDVASFSNRCGEAAQWCLAAPGVSVTVADARTNGVDHAAGTSFAAPMVTGGLAVMKHRFRDQIPNTDLVSRLFATADKSGKFADSSIYGQGMMDLGKALMPVGETMVSTGSSVHGEGVTLALTNLRLGMALGDGLQQSLAGQEIAAFDGLGAPFWFKLSDLTGMTAGPSSVVRLHQLMQQNPVVQEMVGQQLTLIPGRVGGSVEHDLGYATIRVGLRETPKGVQDGHFHLAQDANTLTLMGDNGVASRPSRAPALHHGSSACRRPPARRCRGVPSRELASKWHG